MKLFSLLSSFVLLCIISTAQVSFTDDFESYISGNPLGPQSPTWTTWSGVQGGADDLAVTSTGAHSGTKSLYFTSTSTSGGPADIVLPFSGPHSTGSFTFTTWFKMVAGKGGYFNFQGTNTVSQLYTLNTFFNADGSLEIIDSKGIQPITNTYPQGVWFEFKFIANLNTNSWEVFIDGVSKGTFQNSDFTIASINYYSTSNTNAFWVDDVSFEHVPYTLPALNGAVSFFDVPYGLATQSRTPTVIVRNLGTTTINNFTLTLNANGNNTNQNYTGLNIASGGSYTCPISNSINILSGLNTFTATISNVNGSASDNDASDNTKSYSFTPVTPGSDKFVIGEEATGTWCQWCPRGAVALDRMEKDYHGYFQGIAVHNGDPMVDTIYDTGIGTKIGGYPSMLVDRGADIDPSSTLTDFLTRIAIEPVVKLKNGAQHNSTTGDLQVSLSTTFKQNVTNAASYKVACVIIEDSVKGTGSGYNQSNAYAGGNSGVMGGYETKPNPVPASQMVYMHVARDIAPSFNGGTTFPASVTANSTHISNFQFNILPWKLDKVRIVCFVIDPSGKIENGSTSTVAEAISNGFVLGVENEMIKSDFVSLYPNPTQGNFYLQFNAKKSTASTITITDMQGNIVRSEVRQIQPGLNKIPVALTSFASGQYAVTVTSENQMQTLTLIKQ